MNQKKKITESELRSLIDDEIGNGSDSALGCQWTTIIRLNPAIAGSNWTISPQGDSAFACTLTKVVARLKEIYDLCDKLF